MNHNSNWVEKAKKEVAKAAVKHVEDGFVVGLGSGSTVAYAIQELGEKVKKEKLVIWGIPSSYQAFLLATRYGIKITTFEEHPIINLTIDGADQINPQLNLIKGMGGALTREKIVASALEESNTDAAIVKVTDIQEIMAYDILRTPAVVIDEKVVIKGKVPTKAEIKTFL